MNFNEEEKKYETVCYECKKRFIVGLTPGQKLGFYNMGFIKCLHCKAQLNSAFDPSTEKIVTDRWDRKTWN